MNNINEFKVAGDFMRGLSFQDSRGVSDLLGEMLVHLRMESKSSYTYFLEKMGYVEGVKNELV